MRWTAKNRTSRLRQLLTSRRLPWILLVLVVLGFLIWLAPKPTREYVTADREHRWNASSAPPRRQIVWQPARRIESPRLPQAARESLIRPQPDDEGRTLYFTLRRSGEKANIFRSRREEGKWQPPEQVASLSSNADDFGPVIAADGNSLCLYSNRSGGYGGFDLYVAYRTADKDWTEPANLGPQVNSPADEYDPAITPDGRRLLFASNRSPQLHAQLADETAAERRDRWQATLRSDPQRVKFNLYATVRLSQDAEWALASPLGELNRPGSNEGAPYVAPSGRFLYFASDRPYRSREATNYDLYRARIFAHRIGEVENLGQGVNSPANEIEPALSDEGFRLYFSRNLADEQRSSELYALYESSAVEVFSEAGWEEGNLQAFLAFLQGNWWWMLLTALLAALLASLVWFSRRISLRRMPVPTFLLLALLLHLLLGAGSFFVYFGGDIVERVANQFREVVVASRLASDNAHQSHQSGAESYEKVADLQAVESFQPSDVPRQVTETPNVPVATQSPVMQVPAELNRNLKSTRVASALPRFEPQARPPAELQRQRTPAPLEEQLARIELMETVEAKQLPDTPLESPQPVETQRAASREAPSRPLPARRPLANVPLPAEMKVPLRQENPQPPPKSQRTELARGETAPLPAEAMPVATQALEPAADSAAEAAPVAGKSLPAERTAAAQPAEKQPSPSVAAGAMAERGRAAPTTDAPQHMAADPAEAPPARPRLQLDRVASLPPATSPASIATEQIQAVPQQAADAPSPRPDVAMQRSAAEATPFSMRRLTGGTTAPALPRELPESQAAPQVSTSEPPPDTPHRDALARLELSAPQMADDAPLSSQQLSAIDGPAEDLPPAGSAPVTQQKAQTQLDQTRTLAQPSDLPAAAVPHELMRNQNSESIKPSTPRLTLSRSALEQVAWADEQIATDALGDAAEGQPTELATGGRQFDLERSRAGMDAAPRLLEREDDQREPTVVATSGAAPQRAQVRPLPNRRLELVRQANSLQLQPLDGELAVELPGTPQEQVKLATATGRRTDIERDAAALAGAEAFSQAMDIAQLARVDATEPTRTDAMPALLQESSPRSQRQSDLIARRGAMPQNVQSPIESVAIATSEENGSQKLASAQGQSIETEPASAEMLELPFETGDRWGGARSRREQRLILGSLERRRVDAPLSGTKLASRIMRKPARAPLMMYAEDNIGFRQMYRLRQGAAKRDAIDAFGGNDQTLQAVKRGLKWLATQQYDQGHWSLNRLRHGARNPGQANSDCAATGFALLAYLGDGHTHRDGEYRAVVDRGLDWLLQEQKADGELSASAKGNARMYSHGIATIALCEAYELSKDPALREPAQQALNFIVEAQHEPTGGWRYHPNQAADTSVVGWQVMALKSGQIAGLDVPASSLQLVKKWLAKVEGRGKQRGTFGYTSPNPSPTMTAEALLCLQYLRTDRNDPRLQAGAQYLLEHLPRAKGDNSYYWYYGTQVMYHMEGEYWRRWNGALRDMVVQSQHKSGPAAGTWDVTDNWEKQGGRLYSTVMRILMLEVYYRHLPLYRLPQ